MSLFHRCVPDNCMCPDGKVRSVTGQFKLYVVDGVEVSTELRYACFGYSDAALIILPKRAREARHGGDRRRPPP